MKKYLLILLFSTNLWAQKANPVDLIKNFDVTSYRPQDKGLRELVVQVDIPNLTKQLNDQLIFGKLKNVYFKLFWVYPMEVEVEVIGLPNGFNEIKNELKHLIASRLDVIIPTMLEKRLEGYSLKYHSQDGKDVILASDTTQMKLISEIKATFDKEGKLTNLVNQKPLVSEESELLLTKKGFTENKWIIDEINVKVREGQQLTSIKTQIEYESISGYALPVKISSHTKQVISQGLDKKPIEREIDSSVGFSNYKVNSGEASSYLKKMKDGAVIINK